MLTLNNQEKGNDFKVKYNWNDKETFQNGKWSHSREVSNQILSLAWVQKKKICLTITKGLSRSATGLEYICVIAGWN